uniref:Phosphoglycolate phosphatase n=1 Tax=Chromera velia CCMP2878 TaxID=1169474 RepID=A0A0G4F039_9ALVE|eukprot:Cvel_14370.t1-p1 / transcript=Cvel_14370.t1 / gene=Cvel_14370 / organism=Chromera_velia_CCMP2878 / gene_product=Phosphoglycolate phosphatase, putative / transcript_product=Phosphoglycolate phosphatase, putative / location=Cvel_scaffold1020:7680-11147(+) / protein_length=284 / sequence_SO=supercontig / SO=protein_coding / is_pseudo=false
MSFVCLLLSTLIAVFFAGSSCDAFSIRTPQSPAVQIQRRRQSLTMSQEGPARQLCSVIWDVDGTLSDSFRLGYDATTTVLGRAVSEEEYHYGTRYTTPERLSRHQGLDPEKDGKEFWEVGNELGRKFDELYISLVTMETAGFFPLLRDVVEELGDRGILQGALTNAAVLYAEAVLKCNGVRPLFRSVQGADTVPKPKPQPDGLFQVCKELGMDPLSCVYVGDSPSDGDASRAAGLFSVGVLWGSHKRETLEGKFDVIVESPEDLREVLSKIVKGENQGLAALKI